MAFRSFGGIKIQSSAFATPQPLFGSWITAGIGAPSNVPLVLTLGTATEGGGAGTDADILFSSGDWAWIVDVGGTNWEPVLISAVAGNTVTLGPLTTSAGGVSNPVTTKSHVSGAYGTGSWIIVKQMVSSLFVQGVDGNSGNFFYIGNRYNFNPYYRCLARIAKVTAGQMPYNWSSAAYGALNDFDSSEIWLAGDTANDVVLPSCIVI